MYSVGKDRREQQEGELESISQEMGKYGIRGNERGSRWFRKYGKNEVVKSSKDRISYESEMRNREENQRLKDALAEVTVDTLLDQGSIM